MQLFWQFPTLAVQPGSHCERHILHKKKAQRFFFVKMSVSHVNIFGKPQNNMKPMIIYFQLIKNVVLLVHNSVQVINRTRIARAVL